jgi:DNA-binding NtrC family response regulator
VRPVGGQQAQSFSVRVVAATNRDLRSEVAARRFREDLFYRLAVFRLAVPSLRERPDDVPVLVRHFVADMSGGRLQVRIEDLQRLARYAFPGNVRELRNLVERACALTRGDTLDFDSFLDSDRHTPAPTPGAVAYDLPFKQAKAQIVDQFERAYLERLMEHNQNNLSAAARAADLDRKHLRELLRKHGLITSEE